MLNLRRHYLSSLLCKSSMSCTAANGFNNLCSMCIKRLWQEMRQDIVTARRRLTKRISVKKKCAFVNLWHFGSEIMVVRKRTAVCWHVVGLVLIIIPDLGLIREKQDIPTDRTECGFQTGWTGWIAAQSGNKSCVFGLISFLDFFFQTSCWWSVACLND